MSYGRVDAARQRARQERFSGGTWWKASVGPNLVRFMPPWAPDVTDFYVEGTYHYKVGPNKNMILCTKKAMNQPCYICDLIEDLLQRGDEQSVGLAEAIKGKYRVFYNIVDLNRPDQGVMLFSSGFTIFKALVGYMVNPQWGDFTDPQNGYNITITRTGTRKFDTEYAVLADRNNSAIANPEWLNNLHNLGNFAVGLSYEEQKAIFEGTMKVTVDDNGVVQVVPADDQPDGQAPSARQPVRQPVQQQQAAPMPQPQATAQQPMRQPVQPQPVAPTAQPQVPPSVMPQAAPPVSAPVGQPADGFKPKCFGEFTMGDMICSKCSHADGCKQQQAFGPQ